MSTTLPPFELERFNTTASIDYIKVFSPLRGDKFYPSAGRCRWTWLHEDAHRFTMHDPEPEELVALARDFGDEALVGLEVAVDFWPLKDTPPAEVQHLLERNFVALAARFRPDDELMFGAGFKAAFSDESCGRPVPFHERLPRHDEELVYSHRDEGQGAKAYLKRHDGKRPLPQNLHRIRLECTLSSIRGCRHAGYQRISDLATQPLRPRLAKVFRLIDRPEVRRPGRLSASRLAERELEMNAAWARAGVNAFAGPAMPDDATPRAVEAAQFRASTVLPQKHYRLRRHVDLNATVGRALHTLDRRVMTTFSRSLAGKSA